MFYYNIHGIVKVACNVEGFFPKHFKTGKLDRTDLEIKECSFGRGSYKRFGLFYGDEKSLYFESSFYGNPIYKVLIKDLNGETKLYFTSTTKRLFDVQKLALVLLQIKLLQKGYSLAHAGAVENDGKGHVLFGWPGVGKSSTIFG